MPRLGSCGGGGNCDVATIDKAECSLALLIGTLQEKRGCILTNRSCKGGSKNQRQALVFWYFLAQTHSLSMRHDTAPTIYKRCLSGVVRERHKVGRESSGRDLTFFQGFLVLFIYVFWGKEVEVKVLCIFTNPNKRRNKLSVKCSFGNKNKNVHHHLL